MLNPGDKFGNLEVIEFDHRTEGSKKHYRYYYKCRCSCGKEFIAREDGIKNGHTKSCGCLQRKGASDRWTIHGMTGTQFYQAWLNMKARCFNVTAPYAVNYSLRDISLEDMRWLNFKEFKVDMYESYLTHSTQNSNTTLDRIDVNRGYCKENCRWATHQQQDNNKTTTHWITFNGKTQSLADWSRELELSYTVLSSRLKRGWDLQEAMTTKVLTKTEQNYKPVICLETGKVYRCLEEASQDNNVPLGTARKILQGITKNPRCGKHFRYYQEE